MFLIYKRSTAVYDPGRGTHQEMISIKPETKQAGKQRSHVSSPFSLTLTTRWCLLQRRRWPGGVSMPGKRRLRAGTGVLVYCGHCEAVWSAHSYACFLLWRVLELGVSVHFHVQGVFITPHQHTFVRRRVNTLQGHRRLQTRRSHPGPVK